MHSETDTAAQPVKWYWYAIFAAGVYVISDALTRGARLDGMPIFALSACLRSFQ